MMIKKSLYHEFYKNKHSKTWMIPVLFTMIILLWQCFSNQNFTARELTFGYTYTLYQLPLINSLSMPLMIAVLASRLCDVELKGDTLKQLYTLQSKNDFFRSKYLHEAFYLHLFILGECLVILFCGKIYHFTDSLSPLALLLFWAVSLTVGLILLSLQHFLSLVFKNQIIPLFVGLAGSFLGLFSMYMPAAISRWILYSYFAQFMTAKMHWDRDTREIWFTPVPFPVIKFILFLLFGMVLFLVCEKIFTNREV